MQHTLRSIPAGLALALAAAPLAGGAAAAPPCPSTADVETAVGFPVKAVPVPVDGCMYELTGPYRGVMISLMYQPATRANDVFGDIREAVKAEGPNAQPDRLSLGEGGWGYGSRGKKEAAAVSRGRLYHVEIEYDRFESLKLRDDAALQVIALGMRAAPGGEGSASLDACALATNAEVAQVAGEKPELARFWSAPTASLGGSHCDYDGGSLRLYQGKAPAADLESTLKSFRAGQAQRVTVPGIGDKAFFMIPYPNDKYKRLGLLAVYAGPRVVQLTLDAQGDEPVEATRPRLERFAKLVLPRLR
ncbi:MAG TPA: hypothetical protein VF046_08010 [Gemmatimonadales bacterium]